MINWITPYFGYIWKKAPLGDMHIKRRFAENILQWLDWCCWKKTSSRKSDTSPFCEILFSQQKQTLWHPEQTLRLECTKELWSLASFLGFLEAAQTSLTLYDMPICSRGWMLWVENCTILFSSISKNTRKSFSNFRK